MRRGGLRHPVRYFFRLRSGRGRRGYASLPERCVVWGSSVPADVPTGIWKQGRHFVATRRPLVATRCLLVFTRCLLVFTRCLLVFTRCLLVFTRCLLVFTRSDLVFSPCAASGAVGPYGKWRAVVAPVGRGRQQVGDEEKGAGGELLALFLKPKWGCRSRNGHKNREK